MEEQQISAQRAINRETAKGLSGESHNAAILASFDIKGLGSSHPAQSAIDIPPKISKGRLRRLFKKKKLASK